jgi:hypothetical protein
VAETWRAFTFDGFEGGLDNAGRKGKEDTMSFGSFEDLAGDFGIFDDLGLPPGVTKALPPVLGIGVPVITALVLKKYTPDSFLGRYAGIVGGLTGGAVGLGLWKYQGETAGMTTLVSSIATGLLLQFGGKVGLTLGEYVVSDPVPVLQEYVVSDPVPVLQDYTVEEGMATVGGAPEFLSGAPEVLSQAPEVMSNWSPAFV